jgi:hypothetical protein
MEMPNALPHKLFAPRLMLGALLLAAIVAVLATSSTQARSGARTATNASSTQARSGTRTAGNAPAAADATTAKKKADPRGPSFMTGIGDEKGEMFSNSLWRQLHTQIVRFVTPYDTSVQEYYLLKAEGWIHAAEAEHQQILVAFYHSEYSPTRMPSVATYKRDVAKFIKDFPHVRFYQSYDEANRGNERGVFSSPSAVQAAQYYQALKRDCVPCTVIGLDILDAQYIGPTLTYIAEFKREIYRLKTLMPRIWGLHNYSDVNRLESWRTHDLVRALGGEVWLTETGGIVKFGGAFPNRNGSGLTRSARVLQFMFKVAASEPRIKRVYIYDWTGGNSRTRFDAGLMNAHDQPRPGYVVVCRQLHGARCNVKTAKN